MKLPKDWTLWELRAKRGRKHVLLYRTVVFNRSSFDWTPFHRIEGPVRWYYRRRGERMKPLTPKWWDHYP